MGHPLRLLARFGIDSCLGLIDGRWYRLSFDKSRRNFKPSPYAHAQHAVRNSQRKLVRPLVHRLVRHPHQVGRAYRASAQEFYGFGFEHATIKP